MIGRELERAALALDPAPAPRPRIQPPTRRLPPAPNPALDPAPAPGPESSPRPGACPPAPSPLPGPVPATARARRDLAASNDRPSVGQSSSAGGSQSTRIPR
jgi:hypothetical protein